MINKRKLSQAIIEYVALVLFFSAAVTAMSVYIKRSIEARQRHLNEELNEATRGFGAI